VAASEAAPAKRDDPRSGSLEQTSIKARTNQPHQQEMQSTFDDLVLLDEQVHFDFDMDKDHPYNSKIKSFPQHSMQRSDSQSSFTDLVLLDGANIHIGIDNDIEHLRQCSKELSREMDEQLAKLFSMYFQTKQSPKCSRKSSMPSSGSLPPPVIFKRAIRKSTPSIAP
jgi:hypothetical protein